MAPNHPTDNSSSSDKSTPLKRSHTENNDAAGTLNFIDDTKFSIETLTIIQRVIYSLLNRTTSSSPSPVDKRFRELVREILEKHNVYNCICANIQPSSNIAHDFHGVAESMFEDHIINWGRLIALVGFSVKLAEYFSEQGCEEQVDNVVELTSNFIIRKAGAWIISRGGWKDVVTHFPNTRCDSGQIAVQKDGWFKGILVTATATIGLGALFAVTCK